MKVIKRGNEFHIKYSDKEKEKIKKRSYTDSLKEICKFSTKSKEMKQFLIKIANIRKNYKKMIVNQGQTMDGYSQLYNYNCIADEIIEFLEEIK